MVLFKKYVLVVALLTTCLASQSASAALVGGVLPYYYVPGWTIGGVGFFPWKTSDYKFLLIQGEQQVYNCFCWEFDDVDHDALPDEVVKKLKEDYVLFNRQDLGKCIDYKYSCVLNWNKEDEKVVFLLNAGDYLKDESRIKSDWKKYYNKRVIIVNYDQLKSSWSCRKAIRDDAYSIDLNSHLIGKNIKPNCIKINKTFFDTLFRGDLKSLERMVEHDTTKPLKKSVALIIDNK